MKRQMIHIAVIAGTVFATCASGATTRIDLTEEMKDSIVFLETSAYGYDLSEPWTHRGLSRNWACACAVGEYEVLTTADNVVNLAFAKALRYGQNEFVGAKLVVVDYRNNLCLIRLDPNELSKPLKPLRFVESYSKGAEVDFYWLSADSRLYNGRGHLDRVSVERTRTSYGQRLRYVMSNASQRTGKAEVYGAGKSPIGIACWASRDKDAGLIPAGSILNVVRRDYRSIPVRISHQGIVVIRGGRRPLRSSSGMRRCHASSTGAAPRPLLLRTDKSSRAGAATSQARRPSSAQLPRGRESRPGRAPCPCRRRTGRRRRPR